MNFSPFGNHLAPVSIKAIERVDEAIDFAQFADQLRERINDAQACKALLKEKQALLNQVYAEGGEVGALIRARASLIDHLIAVLWQSLSWSGAEDSFALVAVGGYGRSELHPYSDVDLLVLLKREPDATERDQIAQFATFLWDCGLELGHSVRTLEECVAAAKQDVTVMTNILESRVLLGNASIHQALMDKTASPQMWPIAEFFEAKWDEQRMRYRSMAGPDYNLEPNIKTSPGGLRDIQTIIWIARRYWGDGDIQALVEQGFLNATEAVSFSEGLNFLWRVRYALHVVADRHEDRLLFAHQLKIAEALGYVNDGGNLAVEKFMETYYRCVTRLSVINDVLIQHFDESLAPEDKHVTVLNLNERFIVRNGHIDVVDESVFENDLSALIEIFVLIGERPDIHGIGASTIRLIRIYRERVDDQFRNDPAVIQLFLRLFRMGRNLPRELKRMRQYGMLSTYLPAFGNIVGKMQFDLFHIYTVDVHTLEVVQNVRDFVYQGSSKDYILAARIINRQMQIELLYLAAFFHDIAKGRGGDHSDLGAIDAREFCLKHGFSQHDTALVSWLVENHLVMSSVSQKQDLTDPDVIRDFCQAVETRERLDYLFVLTVSDIKGTNPELWTSWREALMRQLYAEATRAFRRGLENQLNKADLIEARQSDAMQLLADREADRAEIEALWQNRNDEYFLRETVDNIALMTRSILDRVDESKPLIVIQPSSEFGAESPVTQISIYHKLVENRFAFITLAMEELGLNIYDARLLLAGDGMTLDTYYVMDLNQRPIPQGGEFEDRVREKLSEVITSADDRWIESDKPISRRLKSFRWPAQTTITNDEAQGYNVLEVIAPDRPGLLKVVGLIFFEHKLRLHSAKICTLGERVEDVFFLTDRQDKMITDPAKIEAIQRDLRLALDENTQQ